MTAADRTDQDAEGHTETEIRRVGYASPEAAPLVRAANVDLAARYSDYFTDRGGPGNSGLNNDASSFLPPAGAFFAALLDGIPVGCGGWIAYSNLGAVAELKKLYVLPEFRGRGIARSVLTEIEESAREHGRRRMILEAGIAQPEAIALYERCGYERIDDYGYFRQLPEVRSYGRDLYR